MDNKVNTITIIPAIFAEKSGDKHCMINCHMGDDKDGNPWVQKRKFENEMVENIKDPTYLFIGLIHGEGFVQMNFTDAKDFEKMFHDKWSVLML